MGVTREGGVGKVWGIFRGMGTGRFIFGGVCFFLDIPMNITII